MTDFETLENELEQLAILNRRVRGKPSWRRSKEKWSGRKTYRIKYQPGILIPEDEIHADMYTFDTWMED